MPPCNGNWEFMVEKEWRAVQTLEDWRQACAKDKPAAAHQQNSVSLRWRKPVSGRLKCNIDAALFDDNNSFGCGIWCFGRSKVNLVQMHTHPNPIEAEACVMQVLKWLQDKEMHRIMLEIGCMQVVESLKNEVGRITSRCKSLVLNFNNLRVSYVRRQANQVAHSLARASCYFSPA
ncbi:60S ribosomal protein l23 [Trifolium pratense]|uniref:60S ribosomal protein l23 n=1 Tax=Trifolium pratense TaxID=57577 RepID=A0A2K3N4H2_TRIPR|nr:60S ribosomal protein l23 [Trifolium pratense]